MNRKIKRWGLAVAALAVWMSAGAATTRVDVPGGEKWWGLTFTGQVEQPFTEDFEIDLTQPYNGYNLYLPVLMSSAGRYIYSPDMTGVAFDGKTITIESQSGSVEVEKSGKSLREAFIVCALKNFPPDKLTPDPEMFALPMYQTWNELGFAQGENEVLAYARRLLDEGFPAGIMVICNGWQKISGPFEFDPELYPDPKGLVDKLHAMGFRAMLTITPYVPTWGKVYGDARKSGQLALDETVDQQYPESSLGLLDMANGEQFARMREGLDKIKRQAGFDGFIFDCGSDTAVDTLFTRNMMSLGEGMTFVTYDRGQMRPYSPYVTVLETGSMDNDMYRKVIENVTSAGLMGFPYSQIGVYTPMILSSQRSMADYLLLQCGMPVVSVDFAPWLITDTVLYNGVREALNFRASIGDYVKELVRDSGRTGEPLVRHLEYQFPRSGFADCGDEFMLGPKYLFAPCMDRTEKRMVRLPKGVWIDNGGNKVRGPVVREVDCSRGGLIYYELAR